MPYERLCWDCEHLYYSPGGHGYSEWTPGWEMSLNCLKGHWDFDPKASMPTLKNCLTTAQKCKDFEPLKIK